MEENRDTNQAVASLPINTISKKALMESSKWGKLIAMANFITALMLILVVSMATSITRSKLQFE